MRKRLKYKVMSGFLLLVALLVVAGSMSIYEFAQLSKSVTALIDNNYKTIEATKKMTESLEREDSGVLLLMLGKWKEGRTIINRADSVFTEAFDNASSNITEKDEEKYISEISQHYDTFKQMWLKPIVDTQREGDLNWYFTQMHQAFNDVKLSVKKLEDLNHNSLYYEATIMKEKAHRAIMPGIISIISALVFSIILNFFISRFFISPITRMAEAVKNYTSGTAPFEAGINTNDEIKVLETEIKILLEKQVTRKY